VKKLGGFDLVTFNGYREGTLNGIHRYNYGALAIPRDQNTLNAVQGSTADPHPLADLEEGVGLAPHTLFRNDANRFDLIIGDGRALTRNPDEVKDAVGTKHSQPIFIAANNLNEDITAK